MSVQCEICNKTFASEKTFSSKRDLLYHKRYHTMVKCQYCEVSLKKDSLPTHIQRKHKIEKEGVTMFVMDKKKERKHHDCFLCDKKLSSKQMFVKHLKVIHFTDENSKDMPKINCDLCPMMFLSNYSLQIHKTQFHIKKKIKKEFPCPECSSNFSSKKSLNFHKNTIHKKIKKTI